MSLFYPGLDIGTHEMTYPLYPDGPDCQLWDLHGGLQPDVDVSMFDVLVHAEYVPPVLVTLLL